MDKKALPSLDLPKIRKNKDIEMYVIFYLVFQLMLDVLEHALIVRLYLPEVNFFLMPLKPSLPELAALLSKELKKFG